MSKTCVIYLKAGREQQTPWFTNADRANRALAIIRQRYGAAILYRD
jgi:hypothetical protein